MKFKKAAALTMAAAMTLGVTGGMPVSADDDIYEVVVQFPTLEPPLPIFRRWRMPSMREPSPRSASM